MKITGMLAAGALIVASLVGTASAEEALTVNQKKEVEQLVHDYLLKNPEILIEVSEVLKNKQQESMQNQAKSAIQEHGAKIFQDSFTVLGNPKGKVTVVEFFDYQCIHCKKMGSIMSNLVKKDPNLRVIYKEFPIFGKSSEVASKAALAAAKQGKYSQLHDALLKQDKRLSENLVYSLAKEQGLDVEQLKKDMQSKEVLAALEANRKLGEDMKLMGTPAFIIGATPEGVFGAKSLSEFIPGGASEEDMQALIKKVGG